MAQARGIVKPEDRPARLEARVKAEPRHVLEDASILRVSLDDQKRIVKALLHPPKPNTALRRAAARHREMIESK